MTFPDTTFVSQVTKITQQWAQAVNDLAARNEFKLDAVISPIAYGADPTGVADSVVPLKNTFTAGSNKVIELGAGTFRLGSLLDLSAVPLSNCIVRGVPGGTTITGAFDFRLIYLGALNNVIFQDIVFENTYTSAALNNTYANVYTGNTDAKNVRFIRCKFTAPNCEANGLYLYPRTSAGGSETCVVDGFFVQECVFDTLGQAGFGINNNQTSADKYTAVQNVYLIDNTFTKTGEKHRYGMAVTFNGFLSSFMVIGNYVNSPYGIGIENTYGINGSICFNRFRFDPAKQARAMSVGDSTATYPVSGIVCIGNVCMNPASVASYLSFGNNCYFAGNVWDFNKLAFGFTSAFLFLDSNKNTIDGDTYKSDAPYALRFMSTTGTTAGNRMRNCTFDTSGSAAVTATINFDGAGTTDNVAHGRMSKGTGGSAWTQTNSAASNSYGYSSNGTWSPALTFATPGDLATGGATLDGYYQREGSQCTVHFNIDYGTFTWSTSAGALKITGLPFAAKNGTRVEVGVLGAVTGITKAGYTQFHLRTVPGQSYLEVYASGSGVAAATIVAGEVPTGAAKAFYGCITYTVLD